MGSDKTLTLIWLVIGAIPVCILLGTVLFLVPHPIVQIFGFFLQIFGVCLFFMGAIFCWFSMLRELLQS